MGGDMVLLGTMAITAAASTAFAVYMVKSEIWQPSHETSAVSEMEAEKASC